LKHAIKYVVLVTLLVAFTFTMPALAAETTPQSPIVGPGLNVTYPVSLLWTTGTADRAVGDYVSDHSQLQCVQDSPVYLWFKSTSSQNLTNLYLSLEIPQEVVHIVPEVFPGGTTITYSSADGAYLAGPVSFMAGDTSEICFRVVPLQRGYYTLDVQWIKEK